MIIAGTVIAFVFVGIGCVWLSFSAETLDAVAENLGASESPVWAPPIPDYEILGLQGNLIANIAVGLIFTVVILGITLVIGKCLRLKKNLKEEMC